MTAEKGLQRAQAKMAQAMKTPVVWVLLGAHVGDNAQARLLAEALGWPFQQRQLVFNPAFRLPNLLLGARLASLDKKASDPLMAPWPDLVIATGRRSVPVARWIRMQNDGKTVLVQIGRPRAPLGWFDLVVTTPQYGLPQRDNIVQLDLPFSKDATGLSAENLDIWRKRFEKLPRPWTGVLVGGSTPPFCLDAAAAVKLAATVSRKRNGKGGAILLTTGPRTSAEAAAALQDTLEGPRFFHAWEPGTDNPYQAILAMADDFTVTGDSVSMVSEACLTGKPVAVFMPPMRKGPWFRFKAALGRQQKLWPVRLLVETGLLVPPRDVEALITGLAQRGIIDLPETKGRGITPACQKAPRAALSVTGRRDALSAIVRRIRECIDPQE